MRSDMKRVLVDPGRTGGQGSHVIRPDLEAVDLENLEEYDSGPKRGKMSYVEHHQHWGEKQFTDHFGPLLRFLQSRIGKNWDQVWSEICEHADPRSVDGRHLREHIWDFVARTSDVGYRRRWSYFCIDENGYLQENKERYKNLYRKPVKPKKFVFKVEGKFYHQHEGIWYEVEMEQVSQSSPRYGYVPYSGWIDRDVFISNLLNMGHWGTYRRYSSATDQVRQKYGYSPNGKLWIAVKKKAINSRQIKKIKKSKEYKQT